ncbi:MAG: type II toxin-antitoxin system VapC family toxin [Fimbriimonadaceae bacterium]
MIHLLDTATVLALGTEPDIVPWRTRELLAEPGTEISVSVVSVWEGTELALAGKLSFDRPLESWIRDFCQTYAASVLDFKLTHAAHLVKVPHNGGTMFDRLLVATALVEGAAIVSPRAELAAYPVRVVW